MSSIQQLITEHLDIWTTAESGKKSGRGRSSGNGETVFGIKKLRELILELAVRGKLVPQDPKDEPASELLKRIQAEKAKLTIDSKNKKEKPLPPVADDEKPFELPQGWTWSRAEFVSLSIVDCPHSTPRFTSSGMICLDTNSIKLGRIIEDKLRFVDHETYIDRNRRLTPMVGDIVFAREGSVGESCVIPDGFKCCLGQRVMLFRPSKEMNYDYFRLALSEPGSLKRLLELHKGIGAKHVNVSDMRLALIPLPSKKEQTRIVAKVDELMALCDQLEAQHNNAADAHEKLVTHLLGTLTQSQDAADFNANWQRIAEHFDTLFTTEHSIDTLKQTLLQLAVMGKLVPQDPNDEPASELLKRIQAEKAKLIAEGKIKKEKPLPPIAEDEKPFELPVGWAYQRLNDFCTGITSGSTPPQSEFITANGIPYLKVYNIRDQRIDFDYKPQFVSKQYSDEKLKRSVLYPGDVIMNIVGPPLGKIAIIPSTYPEWNCNQAIVFFRPLDKRFSKYIYTYLCAGLFLKDIELVGTAGQDNISVTKSQSIIFPLPPLDEQSRIVAKIEELLALCDQLKSRIGDATQLKQKVADTLVEQALH